MLDRAGNSEISELAFDNSSCCNAQLSPAKLKQVQRLGFVRASRLLKHFAEKAFRSIKTTIVSNVIDDSLNVSTCCNCKPTDVAH
ncbi:hypothetical protein [Nostoc sp.]|uniref:hypothetical protein n=1 Tax=Nostoc sp. TaxID=1180 RepID=UPI002FFCBEBA